MPILVRFMLLHLGIGFALGTASAVVILCVSPQALGGAMEMIETLLFIYALGAAFALGYLGTALGFDRDF